MFTQLRPMSPFPRRLWQLALALTAALIFAALPAAPAQAAGYVVNTLADNTDDDAFCTLREAMLAANNAPANANCGAASNANDTITFSVSGTIVLGTQLPAIVAGQGTLTIDGVGQSVTISGNNSVRVFTVNSSATFNLQNITVANGRLPYGGGGVYNVGTLTVTNSTFSNNSADNGGGVYNQGTLTVTNSVFSGNSANLWGGGGVYNEGTLTVTNSTFSGNSAGEGGGGILNWATLTVTNSAFSGNSANLSGGGIRNWGSATVRNSILANSPSGGNCAGTIGNGGNNLDSGATCGFASNDGSISNTDPLLAPFGDYGGPTFTFALLPGSPAIDGVTYNAPNDCPAADQRGVSRPQGARCDIGAYEYEPPDLFILKTVEPGSAAPGQAIAYTLTFSNTGVGPATNVVITDTIPLSVVNTSVSSSVVITQTAPGYVWAVQELAPGAGGVITITGTLATPLASGTFTNTAVIAAANDSDLSNNTSSASVTVLNAGPVAHDDLYYTGQNNPLTVAAPGVLGNDLDDNGDPLTAHLISDVSQGMLAFNPDGSFVYTPPAGFQGSATFTYQVTDGTQTALALPGGPNNPNVPWVDATGNNGAKQSAAALGLPVRDITLEAWVYPRTYGLWRAMVSFLQDNGGTEHGWDLELDNNGRFRFALRGVGGVNALTYLSSSGTFSTNAWHHVAGVYDGSQMRLYVNGQLQATSTAQSGDISYLDSWLAIGGLKDDDFLQAIDGFVDEVRIWNVARTQAQIQADMQRSLNGGEPGLFAYWRLDEGSGTTTADAGPNNLTGVFRGTPTQPQWVTGVPLMTSSNIATVTIEVLPAVEQGVNGGQGPGGVGTTDGSSNLALWLDAGSEVTTVGSNVSIWADQSGNNANVTQDTAENRPLNVTNALNNQPVVRFDGNDDFLNIPASVIQGQTSFSFFTAFQWNGGGDWQRLWDFGQDTSINGFVTTRSSGAPTNTPRFAITTGGGFDEEQLSFSSALPTGSGQIVDVIWGPSNSTGWRNGDSQASGNYSLTPNNLGAISYNYIGRSIYSDPYLNGDMGEFIIFSAALPDVRRILVENYLSARYNVALSANDVYNGDTPANGDFDLNMAGIGRYNDVSHTQAHSAGIIVVDRSFLQDNGDWLTFGHRTAAPGRTNADLPTTGDWENAPAPQRWARHWHFHRTDAGANGGTVDIIFDFSEGRMNGFGAAPAGPVSNYRLLRRADTTGSFEDIATATAIAGDQVHFLGVDVSLLGSNFTLGTLNDNQSPTAVSLSSFSAAAPTGVVGLLVGLLALAGATAVAMRPRD